MWWMNPRICPPFPPFFGGVGVQPLLSDDCYTVEQQIMRLNYKVKELEEHGSEHDYTELIERVNTLESEYNSIVSEIQTLSTNVTSQEETISGMLTRLASIETNLATLASSLTSLESDINALSATVTSQGNTISSHTTAINNLTNRISTLESELIQYIGNVSGTFTFGSTSDLQVIPLNHTIAPLEPNRTYYILPIIQAGFDPTDESMVWLGDNLIIATSNSQGQITINSSIFGYKGTASSKAYSIRFYALNTVNNV